jgi:hypothetical protein
MRARVALLQLQGRDARRGNTIVRTLEIPLVRSFERENTTVAVRQSWRAQTRTQASRSRTRKPSQTRTTDTNETKAPDRGGKADSWLRTTHVMMASTLKTCSSRMSVRLRKIAGMGVRCVGCWYLPNEYRALLPQSCPEYFSVRLSVALLSTLGNFVDCR